MMGNTPYEVLAEAIVLQAVDDYREALRGKGIRGIAPEVIINECERFFRSDWYNILTTIDGEYLIQNIRKEFIH